MAEALLNTLRKLEANKACANCDTVAKFGHSNVCEKFKTFVCNHCKSAHQSFSHRVKSVTMSNWSQSEVEALKEDNGGGNAVARRTWLATWQDGRSMRKPSETDHLDVFKKFINAVYNDKAYYGESRASAPAPAAPAVAQASSTKTAPSSDLLGFSPAPQAFEANFDAFSAPVQPANASSSSSFAQFDAFSAPVQPASTSTNSSFAQFDAFSAPVKPANTSTNSSFAQFDAFAPAPKSNSSVHDHEWSAFQSAGPIQSTTSAQSSFDPFGVSSAPSSSSTSTSSFSFDPFAPSNPPPQPAMPTPVMQQQFSQQQMYSTPMMGMPTNGAMAPPSYGMNNPMTMSGQGMNPMNPGGASMYGSNGGGGASITSLLDPTLVSNPHIQRMSGNVIMPNNSYGYNNQPQYQQQQQQQQRAPAGRDPFAGLAFN
ncbi:unnamed protein product [Aphanomyces euteiches]